MKKLKFYLLHFDGIWSIPLSMALFWFLGIAVQFVFAGWRPGSYDPSFIIPLIMAGTIVITATNIAILGMMFTLRGLYRYLFGEKKEDGKIINYSKLNWRQLTSWQRYIVAFGVFFYYVSAVIIIALKLL